MLQRRTWFYLVVLGLLACGGLASADDSIGKQKLFPYHRDARCFYTFTASTVSKRYSLEWPILIRDWHGDQRDESWVEVAPGIGYTETWAYVDGCVEGEAQVDLGASLIREGDTWSNIALWNESQQGIANGFKRAPAGASPYHLVLPIRPTSYVTTNMPTQVQVGLVSRGDTPGPPRNWRPKLEEAGVKVDSGQVDVCQNDEACDLATIDRAWIGYSDELSSTLPLQNRRQYYYTWLWSRELLCTDDRKTRYDLGLNDSEVFFRNAMVQDPAFTWGLKVPFDCVGDWDFYKRRSWDADQRPWGGGVSFLELYPNMIFETTGVTYEGGRVVVNGTLTNRSEAGGPFQAYATWSGQDKWSSWPPNSGSTGSIAPRGQQQVTLAFDLAGLTGEKLRILILPEGPLHFCQYVDEHGKVLQYGAKACNAGPALPPVNNGRPTMTDEPFLRSYAEDNLSDNLVEVDIPSQCNLTLSLIDPGPQTVEDFLVTAEVRREGCTALDSVPVEVSFEGKSHTLRAYFNGSAQKTTVTFASGPQYGLKSVHVAGYVDPNGEVRETKEDDNSYDLAVRVETPVETSAECGPGVPPDECFITNPIK